MTDAKINLNNADCIQKVADLFSVRVHNICDETVTSIPHGTLDMIGVGMLLYILLPTLFAIGIVAVTGLYRFFTNR